MSLATGEVGSSALSGLRKLGAIRLVTGDHKETERRTERSERVGIGYYRERLRIHLGLNRTYFLVRHCALVVHLVEHHSSEQHLDLARFFGRNYT